MKGTGRSLRYWSWISIKNMVMLMGFAVFFGVIMGVAEGDIWKIIDTITFYLVLFGIVIGSAIQVSASQCYMPQCLAMGAKRKDTFIGIQCTNMFIAAIFYLTALVLQAVIGVAGQNTWQADTGNSQFLLFYVTGVFLANGFGNLISILSIRFAKIGMVVMVIIMAIFGGTVGAMSTLTVNDVLTIKVPMTVVLVVAIILYAVTAMVQYRVIRKYEIHV